MKCRRARAKAFFQIFTKLRALLGIGTPRPGLPPRILEMGKRREEITLGRKESDTLGRKESEEELEELLSIEKETASLVGEILWSSRAKLSSLRLESRSLEDYRYAVGTGTETETHRLILETLHNKYAQNSNLVQARY